jgi:energy-coupling factor transporter transmembrane protein EcfT
MRGAILDYCLNKFCPLLIILALLFLNFNYGDWIPYVIFGLIIYVERFSFKVGYSVGFCEKNNIYPYNE